MPSSSSSSLSEVNSYTKKKQKYSIAAKASGKKVMREGVLDLLLGSVSVTAQLKLYLFAAVWISLDLRYLSRTYLRMLWHFIFICRAHTHNK
jgi:hypothetical protein